MENEESWTEELWTAVRNNYQGGSYFCLTHIYTQTHTHRNDTNIFIIFKCDFKMSFNKAKAAVTTNYIAVKFPTHTHDI